MSDDISGLTRTVSEENRFGRTNVSWLVDRQAKDTRMYCPFVSFLEGQVGISCRGAACSAELDAREFGRLSFVMGSVRMGSWHAREVTRN